MEAGPFHRSRARLGSRELCAAVDNTRALLEAVSPPEVPAESSLLPKPWS